MSVSVRLSEGESERDSEGQDRECMSVSMFQ